MKVPLEYRANRVTVDGSTAFCETGTGQTLVMSSGEVLFEADRALPAGLEVTLFIAWPATLSKTVGLTLRVSGRIVHADRHIVALSMSRHAFHTRVLPTTPEQTQALAASAGQS